MATSPWWSMSSAELFATLKTTPAGLTDRQAKIRRLKSGQNTLVSHSKRHGFFIFFNQLRSALVILLIAAAIISLVLGEGIEAAVILAIVIMSAVLGFVQEYKAEKTVRSLQKIVSLMALVRRHGIITTIDARDVVLGDVIILDRGNVVPADVRLIVSEGLQINEAPLTGESTAVLKQVAADHEKKGPTARSLAYMGTLVMSGHGEGIVVAVSGQTMLGQTAAMINSAKPPGEFHRGITRFSNYLLIVTLVMTVFVFMANTFMDRGLLTSFLFAMALAVGITPEMLPIIITVALSKGAVRMADKQVITKQLTSIEQLGNMDILCTDKTGTLTEDALALHQYVNTSNQPDQNVLRDSLLCSNHPAGELDYCNNPIDTALWHATASAAIVATIKNITPVAQKDFDFSTRVMSVVINEDNKLRGIIKGARETILPACSFMRTAAGDKPLTSMEQHAITRLCDAYESDGYKLIVVATIPVTTVTDPLNTDLVLTGFLLFRDPPKAGIRESLDQLEALHVSLKIITGDSSAITSRICQDVDIPLVDNRVISGNELEKLDSHAFDHYCHHYSAFARISPEQKQRIVRSLQRQGHCVGFLGDGINDAPALYTADVGISVDTATGVAKEAAGFILLKKNLTVLAAGIIEGRRTFANITKYILNTISANFGNMITIALASLFLPFIPLLPAQILLNNFMSDIPLLFIAHDTVDAAWLQKPKHWDMGMIRRFMVSFGLVSTLFDLLFIIPLLLMHDNPALIRTAWFVESALSEIIITFSIRTVKPLLHSRAAKSLLVASLLTGAFTILIPYLPLGTSLFAFEPLPLLTLAFIGTILLSYLVAAESLKHALFAQINEKDKGERP